MELARDTVSLIEALVVISTFAVISAYVAFITIRRIRLQRWASRQHDTLRDIARDMQRLSHCDAAAIRWECLRLSYRIEAAADRERRPRRNVDRFKDWKEAWKWFYENDRKNPDVPQVGMSAAFLEFLFAKCKW